MMQGALEDAIIDLLDEARGRGEESVTLTAGQVHKRGAPVIGGNHRIRMACNAMRKLMRDGDRLVSPPHDGTRFSVEYRLAVLR